MSRELGGGFERRTIEIPLRSYLHVLGETKGDRQALIRWYIQAYWTWDPRPSHWHDILSTQAAIIGDVVKVDIIVKRGHYVLAFEISKHQGDIQISNEGKLTCTCHPGQTAWVHKMAMPDYGRIFDESVNREVEQVD